MDSKMADHVDFDDEDVDEHKGGDNRAVTCRYDMAKLRRIGELEDDILEWIADKKGIDVDDLDSLFSVEKALDTDKAGTQDYMEGIAKDCGVSAGEFIDKFLNEIEDLKSIEVKK